MNTQEQVTRPRIHAAICEIMKEIGGVEKNRKNQQQGYSFRGIADVYLACQPVMARHGVHVAPVEIRDQTMTVGKSSTGKDSYHLTMRVLFRAFADDGSWVPVETIGESIDSSDKAANKAMSQAMKYCLVQLFALPEEDPDIDTENVSPEIKTGGRATTAKAQSASGATANDDRKSAVESMMLAIKEAGISDKERAGWISLRMGREIKVPGDLSLDEVKKLTAAANDAKARAAQAKQGGTST